MEAMTRERTFRGSLRRHSSKGETTDRTRRRFMYMQAYWIHPDRAVPNLQGIQLAENTSWSPEIKQKDRKPDTA